MSAVSSSSAFDAHAPNYDDVATSALGTTLRSRVHEVVTQHLSHDSRVLDIGCGTGIDTQWLAERARTVHAVDPSTAMTEQTRSRCAALANVTVETAGALDVQLTEPVDLVLANFGAINCAGPLASVGDQLARLLRPGGIAVLVTMPAVCPAERAIAALTRNKVLWQRRRSGAENHPDYSDLTVTYANATQLDRAFDGLDLIAAESLGLVLPPFEQRSFVENRPRLLRALDRADRVTGPLGGRLGWGDHLITTFVRRPEPGSA